jgi:PAS domain S-box-containing protein
MKRRATRARQPKAPKTKPVTSAFFDHANIGMAVLQLDKPKDPGSLRVVAINDAAKRVAAVPDSIVGVPARDIPEASGLEMLADVVRVITEKRPIDLGDIAGVFLPDRTFLVKVFPIPPKSCGLIVEDVTAQRHSERAERDSEERFRKAFEASPAGMCVFTLKSRILTDVNPRFVELVGHGSAAALIGKHIATIGMWSDQEEYDALAEQLRRRRSIREASITYRTFAGQVRRALVSLELLDIDGEERVLGLFWRV